MIQRGGRQGCSRGRPRLSGAELSGGGRAGGCWPTARAPGSLRRSKLRPAGWRGPARPPPAPSRLPQSPAAPGRGSALHSPPAPPPAAAARTKGHRPPPPPRAPPPAAPPTAGPGDGAMGGHRRRWKEVMGREGAAKRGGPARAGRRGAPQSDAARPRQAAPQSSMARRARQRGRACSGLTLAQAKGSIKSWSGSASGRSSTTRGSSSSSSSSSSTLPRELLA